MIIRVLTSNRGVLTLNTRVSALNIRVSSSDMGVLTLTMGVLALMRRVLALMRRVLALIRGVLSSKSKFVVSDDKIWLLEWFYMLLNEQSQWFWLSVKRSIAFESQF